MDHNEEYFLEVSKYIEPTPLKPDSVISRVFGVSVVNNQRRRRRKKKENAVPEHFNERES